MWTINSSLRNGKYFNFYSLDLVHISYFVVKFNLPLCLYVYNNLLLQNGKQLKIEHNLPVRHCNPTPNPQEKPLIQYFTKRQIRPLNQPFQTLNSRLHQMAQIPFPVIPPQTFPLPLLPSRTDPINLNLANLRLIRLGW